MCRLTIHDDDLADKHALIGRAAVVPITIPICRDSRAAADLLQNLFLTLSIAHASVEFRQLPGNLGDHHETGRDERIVL